MTARINAPGDFAHAEDVVGEVLVRNPTNISILTTLAQIRLSRKNWPGALAVADNIGKLGNNAGIADQIRASVLANQNKLDESVASLLERALQR